MLMFLEYHLYKLHCSLASLDQSSGRVKPTNPLARFEEKHKDKLVINTKFNLCNVVFSIIIIILIFRV